MIVRPVATATVVLGGGTLPELLDTALSAMRERSILAVTSKVVSLCEGRVAPMDQTDKASLVRQESQRYLPAEASRYEFELAIANNTLAPSAGIDAS
ncbi:MAG TPA: putative folate metabolism gamma-glutamate ligase, partial [Candidatus Saccharimonadia bacterium]